jgi:hyperosmotically inducible periplasmic protein
MKTPTRNLILASTLVLAATSWTGTASAQVETRTLVDVRQETQIWTTYALNPYLRASDLKVSVQGGKATLTGTVDEGINKDLAKQIALGVSGIDSVDNKISVEPDYAPVATSDARTFGEFIDDASITAAVKSKLLWSKYSDGLSTDVDTKNSNVTLTGTADSPVAKDLAGRLAKNTRGVESVDNQLIVKKPEQLKKNEKADDKIKGDAAKGHEIADTWITAKVKSTFMYSRNVASSDISVTTSNGAVDLSGMVDSGAERALAIEIAQNIKGVKGVTAENLKF